MLVQVNMADAQSKNNYLQENDEPDSSAVSLHAIHVFSVIWLFVAVFTLRLVDISDTNS